MVYGAIYRKLLFPFHDRVIRRRSVWDEYRAISGASFMPREELDRLRSERLSALVEHCRRNVPLYAEIFESRGLGKGEAGDISVLREAGVLTSKETVRAAGERALSLDADRGSLYDTATSGSSGTPALFYMAPENWCRRTARKLRSEDWMGKPPGTRATMIWGHKPDRSTLEEIKDALYWRFQNYQFLSAYDIGDDALERAATKIRRFGSRFIESYVTPVYLMARVMERRGLAPPDLDGIIIGAERLHPHQKEVMERAFRCPVYNRYGATEFSNVASECREREGLHINEDDMWVEVLGEDGRPVAGEAGDLVITDLTNYAMPLLRYRIGDRAIMSERACSCGRTFRMLEDITGRESDAVRTPGGRALHDQYFLWKLARTPGMSRYQIVQKAVDLVVVRVEHDGSVPEEETARFISGALAGLGDHGIEVRVEFVDTIPLTGAGKHRAFISELPADNDR